MKDSLEARWKRHGRLLSLLAATSERLGDRKLRITHTDPSLLAFDSRDPCPWLNDIGQVEYLLANHSQIVDHGRSGAVARVLLVPKIPPVVGPLLYTYYAAVKAVVHLQLYEGVRLWIAFVDTTKGVDLSFSHSSERVGKNTRVWSSSDYYVDIESCEIEEASRPLAERVLRSIDSTIAGSLPITPVSR